MASPYCRFVPYADGDSVPNIVVDGSPAAATVLALTHWPGFEQPAGTDVDTSAEMAFAHLDHLARTGNALEADAVTNNHFDQDGTVGLFALVEPEFALAHRDLLVDVARAGDFGTYRHRVAARISMVLSAFTDPDRSPISGQLTGGYDDDTSTLYAHVLPRFSDIVSDIGAYVGLWSHEDDELSASEAALADETVVIEEHPEIDLAVVRIDPGQPVRSGHRFGGKRFAPVHPMAINNATDRLRLLTIHRRHYQYVDRYETWVQLRSRRPLPRVDLRPLADELTGTDDATWSAAPPSALTPTLSHDGESSLEPDDVISEVTAHLRSAPPAWNPYELPPETKDPCGQTTM